MSFKYLFKHIWDTVYLNTLNCIRKSILLNILKRLSTIFDAEQMHSDFQ